MYFSSMLIWLAVVALTSILSFSFLFQISLGIPTCIIYVFKSKKRRKSGEEWKTKPWWGKNMSWTTFAINYDHPMLSKHLSKPYRLSDRVVTQRVYHFFIFSEKKRIQFNKKYGILPSGSCVSLNDLITQNEQ